MGMDEVIRLGATPRPPAYIEFNGERYALELKAQRILEMVELFEKNGTTRELLTIIQEMSPGLPREDLTWDDISDLIVGITRVIKARFEKKGQG